MINLWQETRLAVSLHDRYSCQNRHKIILTIFVLAIIVLSSSIFSNAMAAKSSSSQQSSSDNKPTQQQNDKATKGDLGPNDHPAKPEPTTTNNNNNNNGGSGTSIENGVNILCHGVIVHHSCEPTLKPQPTTTQDNNKEVKAIPIVPPPGYCHGLVSIDCFNIQHNHTTTTSPPTHHSKAYLAGYQMGCTDTSDQTNFINSGGLAHHSKAFVKGYNDAFAHGPCP